MTWWKREAQAPPPEPPRTFSFEGQTLTISFYTDDVQSITVDIVDSPEIPLEVGATFTCRIASIARTVVER